ncbi:hypothetical protein O181_066467 [Austropuccinia psidii MF-1]|uniref:Integrase catalytic domain-containing protein n=1 Tax=Austropuccinia psidii MF-1 TaxID=1389203 RepID=A0A9Q3I4B7_9BASI|nr:hypothetical protein [Austropuccinia psidii MF-1]
MPERTTNVNYSSLEEEVIKTKMVKLTRTNWVQWSFQFENFLISKGMDDLLEPPSQDVKETAKFKKKNSGALKLLWSSVSTEFEGVLLNNKSSFYDCWISLGNCCGKNSVVVISCTLHKLINLKYEPPSSLEKHINDFHKLYASYLSISADSTISMNLSSTYEQHALLFDKNKQAELSKTKSKNQAEAGRKKKGFKDKRKGRNNNNQNTNHENDMNKQFEKIEKMLEKIQAANNIPSVNEMSQSKDPSRTATSDSEAFIANEINAMVSKQSHGLIYLDSGAGRTVVNDLSLLVDPTPVKKQIHTFSTPVKVTHQGTLDFKGIKLYPLYYVPNGPVNLLSVSQLCDHGLKLTMKSNIFIIKYENHIVDFFQCEGNLFVSKLPSTSVYSILNAPLDWHLTLGHPSDSYIKALLKEGRIKGNFTQSSSCQVCQLAKIRNRPHSQVLPRANAPFLKIHMDTLQINPPTCRGYKYVLVLINDFSRFNRIYSLSEKGQAEECIKTYLMEIKNKLDITPAYLHTDCGGEFSSQSFLNHLASQGISLERGPPESPQTNGIAECFCLKSGVFLGN